MGIEAYNEMNPYSSYIYECCCGERYRNVAAAAVCKKCRNYSVWGYTKYVINIKTDEVVYGTMPTDEEYRVQAAAAEERWAEEQAAWQQERWRRICTRAYEPKRLGARRPRHGQQPGHGPRPLAGGRGRRLGGAAHDGAAHDTTGAPDADDAGGG